jgi:hypothetical protein
MWITNSGGEFGLFSVKKQEKDRSCRTETKWFAKDGLRRRETNVQARRMFRQEEGIGTKTKVLGKKRECIEGGCHWI